LQRTATGGDEREGDREEDERGPAAAREGGGVGRRRGGRRLGGRGEGRIASLVRIGSREIVQGSTPPSS
jgi:hypothetical protein